WGSVVTVDGTPVSNPATITVQSGVPTTLDVQVTPDAVPGIGRYTLQVSSVNNSGAPMLEQVFHVISGITDLIVTHPQAEPWEQLYIDGLTQANNLAFVATSKDQFIKFGQANALSGVNNLYVNVSWTFPSLTDDEVGVLAAFMDNGGDVMIAGQDIAWDQSGAANSYGTPVTEAFFASHMLATYVADGSNSSTTVNFLDADAVFGTVPNGSIADVFGGNTYPDQITPIAPAVGILHYNTNVNQIGGLRSDNGTYKLVYFGVGPEQMTDAGVGRSMIQLSHDWFYGVVSVEELDAQLANALGQAYPVPANDRITIPLNGLDRNGMIEITDATGRVALQQSLRANTTQVEVNIGGLSNGVYRYALRTSDGMGTARTFQVVR
ncbi:MAG: T9SS type A sorting domain-containing protein, partial [Flavobacteriales bacterium]|nr:T9SS type A sorting domain-containing protein [Flavobacteriales bacterium]